MFKSLRSASATLLLESGEQRPLARLPRANARDWLVLSRALCSFRLFRPPPGLNISQLVRAARSHAEARAPFAQTGQLLLRSPAGVAIWYWNAAKAPARGRVVAPESLWRPAGEGWRIVTCADGYEAEHWRDGALVASSWRREPFTSAQWASFVLEADSEDLAPTDPPEPEILPLSDVSWTRRAIGRPLGWRDLEQGAVTVGLCAGAVAVLFAAQAARHASFAQAEKRAADAIELTLVADEGARDARRNAALLRAYASAVSPHHTLPAVADTFETLQRFGLEAYSWRATGGRLSVIVNSAIADAPVAEIVAALEESAHLCRTAPEIAEPGRFELRATIVDAAGRCGVDEGGERPS